MHESGGQTGWRLGRCGKECLRVLALVALCVGGGVGVLVWRTTAAHEVSHREARQLEPQRPSHPVGIDPRGTEVVPGNPPVPTGPRERRMREQLLRESAEETELVVFLTRVAAAQYHFAASVSVDEDEDGRGEFGGLQELGGHTGGRGVGEVLPPLLVGVLRPKSREGVMLRFGYAVRVWLPGRNGAGVAEPDSGYSRATGLDPNLCERAWCCYAWRARFGERESRVYFVNQQGAVLVSEGHERGETADGPPADAAFRTANSMIAEIALDGQSVGGRAWRRYELGEGESSRGR